MHKAIGILQIHTKTTDSIGDKYFSTEEMTSDVHRKFVHPLLLKALVWLTTSHELYSEAGDFKQCDEVPDKLCFNIVYQDLI